MNQENEGHAREEGERWGGGLPMVVLPSPEKLAEERKTLVELEHQGFAARTRGYWKFVGPGYMQSALTLGSGSVASALFGGAVFGYRLLWVAPVAMLLGMIMLAGVSHQTLSTGLRPLDAMKRYAGAPFAWAWAGGALIACIVWQFPQFSLAGAVAVDMGKVLGLTLKPWWVGVAVLVWAGGVSMSYGSSARWIRGYEKMLKYMVWMVVVCLGLSVMKTGVNDWGALLRGFYAFEIPGEQNGVRGIDIVLGGLAAAVGVNMVFLYPHSLLAKGWGREHRRLARFDLFTGMVLPFTLATSLLIIATANTLHLDPSFAGKSLSVEQAARTIASLLGMTFGRVIFNLGILAMALSTITIIMLTAGFVCSEIFGFRVGGWKYRLGMLVTGPAVLGTVLWPRMAVWVAIPTSILCGFLLPAAYFGFILLQRSRPYLGDDVPRGFRGKVWFGAMIAGTTFLACFLVWYAVKRLPVYLEKIF